MNLQVHRNTPTLKVNDSRGLAVRQVDYLRTGIETPALALISRQVHDALGRLIEQWDPRLFGMAPKPNVSTVYGLSGHAAWFDSVDAGWRLNLFGVAGQSLRRWDARGCHWQTDYDNQLRVVAVHEQPPEQPQTIVEYVEYADNLADPAHNLRGQKIVQDDPSGSLVFPSFSLLGAPLRETRTFFDGMACTTSWRYNAKGAVLTQIDAAGHRQRTGFDLAGQLKQVFVQLKDESDPLPLYQHLTYNAFGQLDTQRAGNGVVSTWGHDPADGRLTSLKAGIPGQALRQDLGYVYDRTGNVLRIEDHTLSPVFFANQRTDGHRAFIYDSLYRLTGASGFEGETPHLQPGLPELIKPEDCGRRFNYTQHYDYDPGGNLTRLRHVRDGHCYTRCLRIAPHSNRGLAWQAGDPDPDFSRGFDAHGNQGLLQAGQPLGWNYRDQLNSVTLIQRDNGANDEETYAYSQGVRVHKRLIRQARALSHIDDVRYLPGLEIRTRDDSQELHVITLAGGHGSVRCLYWAKGKPDGIDAHQLRYSLDDHLGSSSLELDRDGALISREVYYPFGGSCWWAARSAVEADYKTVRYSGKEMDISGLYYYGQRYYAPWLQRWVSADPAGDVDGLNLYAMVGNNPMLYVDRNGDMKHVAEALNTVAQGATTAANIAGDLHNAASTFDALVPDNAFTAEENKAMTFWKFARSKSGRASFKWGAGIGLAIGGAVGTVFGPGWGNLTGSLIGAVVGGAVGVGIRYLTYKHNFKAGQYTEAIQTVSRDVANAANDVANGKVPEPIQNKLEEFREKAVTSLMEQLSPLEQLDMLELMDQGIKFRDAILAIHDRAKEVTTQGQSLLEELKDQARELSDASARLNKDIALIFDDAGNVVLSEQISQGLTQAQASVSSPSRLPIPKPRPRRTLETSV